MDPNWNGNSNVVGNQITGIPGMGPKAALYLVEILKTEDNKIEREMLFRALTKVADAGDAKILAFMTESLLNGEAKYVCLWFYEQYSKYPDTSPQSRQILNDFLSGMNSKDVNVRKEVCKYLGDIYNQEVIDCFTKAIDDGESAIRLNAARYLASAEWLDLSGWLERAVNEPTYTRYLASVSIISEIEKKFNITKGKLPDLNKEDFVANSEKLEQFGKILRIWKDWTVENQSYSAGFFEKYRQKWVKPLPERPDENAIRKSLQRGG